MPLVLLALGSNLGEGEENLRRAIDQLSLTQGLTLHAVSSLHTTEPLGGPAGQGAFTNAAAVFETQVSPIDVLAICKDLEQAMGRTPSERWASRPLDVDLLLYDQQVLHLPTLEVPHPRMSYRPFVLDPAVEVARDWRHPRLAATLGELHQRLHQGDNTLVIYGGEANDRRWHADQLLRGFPQLRMAGEDDLQTWLAVGKETSRQSPRLAIQLQKSDESPMPGVPTLAIPATTRSEGLFDTVAAVAAVWPDLCRAAAGE